MLRIPLPTTPPASSTARTHISHSAITTYQTCPLRYFFRYELGLTEQKVSANLVLGGAIHAAVQAHFEHLLAGSLADLDTLGNACPKRAPLPAKMLVQNGPPSRVLL